MDPETKELVKRLHADPDMPGGLDMVRAHLANKGQPKWLASVLEWWSGKTRNSVAGGAALLEAVRLFGPIEPARARAALQKAVELHPGAAGFEEAIKSCYPGDADALSSILAHRLNSLRTKNEHQYVVAAAHQEYYESLVARGHLEGHEEIVRALAQDDPNAQQLLQRMRQAAPGAAPGAGMSSRDRLDADLDSFLDDDDDEATMVAMAPDPELLMRSMEADTDAHEPGLFRPAPAPAPQRRDQTKQEPLHGRPGAPGHHPVPAPAPARRSQPPRASAPSSRHGAPPPAQPRRSERPVAEIPRAAPAPEPAAQRPVPAAAAPEPRRAPPMQSAAAPVGAGIEFDPRALRRFEDDYDEDDQSPMVGIDPRAVLVVGERASAGELALEIVRFRDKLCLDAKTLAPGALRNANFPGMVRIEQGAAEVRIIDADGATHIRADKVREPVGGNAVVSLVVGDRLDIDQGPLRYSLRLGFASRAPTSGGPPMPIVAVSAGIFFALLAHLFLAFGIDYVASAGMMALQVDDRPQEEIFAEARLQAPETPPPPPRPRPPRRRVERQKAPRQTRTELPRTLRDRVRRLQNNQPRSDDATENLLERLTTPNAGTGQTLEDVTTNIQAVAGGPLAGGLTVSGVQSALDGVSGVNTAAQPGSANVGSLGGADAAGSTMALTMRNEGAVRGRVRAVSALGRQTGGSLSRSEVQRVINGSIGRIQRCYERALIATPAISGRVTFAWTIRPNGRVSGVREQTSTLGNPGVTSCIAGVIRRMRFPQPQGGAVQISYPFMFQRAP